MAQSAVNEAYLDDPKERAKAGWGMLYMQRKPLHPGYHIFRFASMGYRHDWLTNGWWIGFSPFGAIDQLAHGDEARLSRIARAALAVAIDPSKHHFNRMDVLLSARISTALAAWTGTPKTIAVKKDKKHVARWEPDPSVTQLYIPGLDKIPPGALTLEGYRPIPWTTSPR